MKYIRKQKHLNEVADPTLGGVSHAVQGTPGYVYAILPLSHSLEMHANKPSTDYYIHTGCLVSGIGLLDGEKYTGHVAKIVKNSDGSIHHVDILTQDTRQHVHLAPDKNLRLIIHKHVQDQHRPSGFNMEISRNMKI